MLKIWQRVFILLLLLLILFPPFPKASSEHSLLTPGAQSEAAGASQGRQGCQVGSDQGRSRRLDQSLKLWGSPADAFPFLGLQGARTGLQGQEGAQSVRRDGCICAAAALKCNPCSPCSHSPAAHSLTQAAISSDCSGTADFNINLLLLPFEINTASSLILPVA